MQNPLSNSHEMYRLPIGVVDHCDDDRCVVVPKRSNKSNRTTGSNNAMTKKMKNKNKNDVKEQEIVSNELISSSTSVLSDYYSENDVLCGRGRISLLHEGNKRFCDAIEQYLDEYINASNRNERSKVVQIIMDVIADSGGNFKRKTGYPPRYITLTYIQCREKVGHALRDTAKLIYKKRGLILPSTFFRVDNTSDNNNTSSNSSLSSNSICGKSSSNLHEEAFSTEVNTTSSTTINETMSATMKTLVNAATSSTPHETNENHYKYDDDQMNLAEDMSHIEVAMAASEIDDSIAKLLEEDKEEDDDIIMLSQEQGNLCLGISRSLSSSDFIYIPQCATNIPLIDDNESCSIVMATAMLVTTNNPTPSPLLTTAPAAEANVLDVQIYDEIDQIYDDYDTIPYDQSRGEAFVHHHGNFNNYKDYDDDDNYYYLTDSQINTETIVSNSNIISNDHYVPLYNDNIMQIPPYVEPTYYASSSTNEAHYSDIIEPNIPPTCNGYHDYSFYEDYEDTKLDGTPLYHDEIAWDVKAIAEPITNDTHDSNLGGSNDCATFSNVASVCSFQMMSFDDDDDIDYHDNGHDNNGNYNYNHNNDAMEIMNSSMTSLCLSHDSIEQQQKVLVVLCGNETTSLENYNNNIDYDDKKE